MDKILSIIIPTYNMEKYLRKCLNSLIVSDENMQLLEVLVVNDGSKDSSSTIAHEYEAKYPKTFRVIDKENGNYGSCINRGMKEATGEYVKVLDADDYFDKEVFDTFITYLCDINVDLVISDYCVVDQYNKVEKSFSFPLPSDTVFTLHELPLDTIQWLWHHGITYRTDNIRRIDYQQTEGISYTDDEWIFIPMVTVERISYFPHNMYYYFRGREGQTFDPEVLKRSFNQKTTVAYSMLNNYHLKYDSFTPSVEYYMTNKLKDRMLPIYHFYLFESCTTDGNETLKKLDEAIKKDCPKIYIQLDHVRNKLRIYFIRIWRNSQYNPNTPILYTLRFIDNIKTKVLQFGGHS